MPKKSGKTILVTGATGKQGGAVLRHLREKNFSVSALTRDPNKPEARALVGRGTEVVRGDLNDPASLARAMEGVDGVYSVQSHAESGVEAEIRQGMHAADAAKRVRVEHFVYSSVAAADKNTGITHFDSKFRIEQHIRTTGLHYTIFRPAFFMENWLGMRTQLLEGVLALPLRPETTLQMIAVDDIGAAVTMAFTHPRHWDGRAVELAGDELSMSDLAASFGRMLGREVRYEQMGWDQFEQRLGREITTMWRLFDNGGFRVDLPALRQEMPNLMTFERWLQSKWTKHLTA
ncbi:MAG TPA: NmrA/HSCARG family protein [Bryobacteraceae bacterium]|nr:NmrA/HSCARG family protein [Bryobacteraceae bacterium]